MTRARTLLNLSWGQGARTFAATTATLMVALPGCSHRQHSAPPVVVADSDSDSDRAEAMPDSPVEAAWFRYQQRAGADGIIPDGAFMRAKAHRDEMLRHAAPGGVMPSDWQWLGPGNIGGRIRPILIHPKQHDVMWIGAAGGGVWKTTDGGNAWFPLDDFLPSLSVASLDMRATSPNTIYAGTGEGFFDTVDGSSNTAAMRGAGIFKSIDGGETWSQMPGTDTSDFYFVNRIALHPTNVNEMVVATTTGIWRTTDDGASWTRTLDIIALDVKRHPTNPNRLVASGRNGAAPYYSTNGGVSWIQASGAGGLRQELAYAPSDPNIVYACVSNSGSLRTWRSLDGGMNYTLQQAGGVGTYDAYNNTIWVDPTDPDILVIGGVWLYFSGDAGVNFQQRYTAAHPDMHGIVNHPGYNGTTNRIVYFATDGGIWRTDDVYGTGVLDLNNNLGITQFYGAAINPTTGHIAGGTQDNGSLSYQGDPQNWTHYFGGDGGYGAADPTDPNIFYGEVQRARIHRSTNGGATASYIYNRTNNRISDAGSSTNCNFIPFLLLDPNDPNRMLVACRRLWRSNNVKDANPDWFVVKDEINGLTPPGGGGKGEGNDHFADNDPRNIATIAVAEGNSDLVWVGHNNGEIWFTTNGTDTTPTWTRVDDNGSGLPDRWPSTIAIDRTNHNRIFVAFMEYADDNLWLSEDGGTTWQNVTGSGTFALPPAPVAAIAIHRTRPQVLYAGTDVGMFVSVDGGNRWTADTRGPGTAPIEQLIWKNNNELMAVTHGRGILLATIHLPIAIDSVTVQRGTHLAGDEASIVDVDADFFRVRSAYGFLSSEPNVVDVRLSGASDLGAPAGLLVRHVGRLDNPGGATTARLRNWASGQLDTVHAWTLGQSLLATEFLINGVDDYIRTGDRQVELSIKQVVVATFQTSGFRSFTDQVDIVPQP
ncbi:MAG: WD40/YVTN/BNR-like repeat-containing protein [Phycisphaerales bacterium]